ncbi:MAG: hypothetical protein ABUS49_06525, partial [Acidobacteriota bacterium]
LAAFRVDPVSKSVIRVVPMMTLTVTVFSGTRTSGPTGDSRPKTGQNYHRVYQSMRRSMAITGSSGTRTVPSAEDASEEPDYNSIKKRRNWPMITIRSPLIFFSLSCKLFAVQPTRDLTLLAGD